MRHASLSAVTALLALGCTEYTISTVEDPVVDDTIEEVVAPVAITGPTQRVKRHIEVVLDGSLSYDPDDPLAPLEYLWTVTDAPEGATWHLEGDETAHPVFTADAVGLYQVSLVVVDEQGHLSQNPAATFVQILPYEDLEIELSWDRAVDLDLHLVRPGGEYYSDDDCFFGNPEPDWGDPGDVTQNPVLHNDDDLGTGPEVITLQQPEEGVYTVYVHYFNERNIASPATTPRLQVWGEGELLADIDPGPTLASQGQVWIAGTLDWATLTFTADDALTTHEALGGPDVNK